VVVTTNILGDIVGEVVGEVADVEVLMPAGTDPQSFAVSAAQVGRMEDADLIVVNGLGLEAGVLDNAAAAADRGVAVLEVAPELGPIAFAEGADDDAGQLDPHVLTDPARMRQAVDVIAERAIDELAGVDPDVVREAAGGYAAELADMEVSMVERFEQIPVGQRRLVTDHHVFG